jgi:hypothetical protein
MDRRAGDERLFAIPEVADSVCRARPANNHEARKTASNG